MNLWDFRHKKHLYRVETLCPRTKCHQYTQKTEITHENTDHTLEVFKLKLSKSGNVLLIHVEYNIRSPVAAQPMFLELT